MAIMTDIETRLRERLFQTGTSPDIRKDLVDRLVAHHFADYIDSGFSIRHD
jgi:hypothetical protein